jgi:hypothetical protein
MIDRGLQVAGEVKRSEHWPKVEEAYKKANPHCVACGGPAQEVNVHHRFPFHLVIAAGRPDLELDPRNLITLCVDPDKDHHLYIGHLGDFVSYNVDVEAQARSFSDISKVAIEANASWNAEVAKRPSGHFANEADKVAFAMMLTGVFGAEPKVDLKGDPI